MNKKRRDLFVKLRKLMRPWCKGNPLGSHTMIEYRDEKKKRCHDCSYSEDIYTEVD